MCSSFFLEMHTKLSENLLLRKVSGNDNCEVTGRYCQIGQREVFRTISRTAGKSSGLQALSVFFIFSPINLIISEIKLT